MALHSSTDASYIQVPRSDVSQSFMANKGCACPADAASISAAALCLRRAATPSCSFNPTNASEVTVAGFNCTRNDVVAFRGFFVVSRDAQGDRVCTGGDAFHLWVVDQTGHWRFAALSQYVGEAMSWINTSAALMPGTRTYALSLTLVETQDRGLQHAEGREARPPLSADGDEVPLLTWLRDRRCVWERVPLRRAHRSFTITTPLAAGVSLPACTTMPPATSFAYRAVPPRCEPSVADNLDCVDLNHTWRRILDSSNEPRWQRRRATGFQHALISQQCRFRWIGESALTKCLAGRSVLNIGSNAVDLQRGLARINSTLVGWTQVRPGPQHPNVADFHRAFERHWQQCFLPKRGSCDVRFGASLVRTVLKRGLREVLPEAAFPQPSSASAKGVNGRRQKLASGAEALALMCQYEIVVFESGVEDVSMPPTRFTPLRDRNLLLPACAGRSAVECAALLPAATNNESWRATPLVTYTRRLLSLMDVWKACKRAKPLWRGIFKLATAPRARSVRPFTEPEDCERAQDGYSSQPHDMATVNEVARRVVEHAGFEVFDPYAATLHASPTWFDAITPARERPHHGGKRAARASRTPGLEYEIHAAETVSDMVTQMLLHQLCG